jgi:thiamine-phosphate pyrophosphorylase
MICLVTDRRRLSDGSVALDRLVDLVAAAANAGVDVVQVRERDLAARALERLVVRCLAAASGTSTKVLVNDRADVALGAGAHGVHLRGDSIGVSAARALVGDRATVGRSVHGAAAAGAEARAGGLDYLIFGTLYPTPSKDAAYPLASLDDLRAACRLAVGLPVLAIGGVTVERAADLARAGAAGMAGVGLFVPPSWGQVGRHVETVVRQLRRAFDTCEAVT